MDMISVITDQDTTATQGSNSASATGATGIEATAEAEAVFRKAGASVSVEGMTVNVNRPRFPHHGFAPRTFVRSGVVTDKSGRKIAVDWSLGSMDFFDSFSYRLYNVGTVKNFRVSSGVFAEIGEASVTDAGIAPEILKVVEVSGTSAQYKFAGFATFGQPMWFRGVSRDTTGKLGTPSAWVQYIPLEGTSASASNPDEVNPTEAEGAGAYGPPTGLTATANGSDGGLVDITFTKGDASATTLIQLSWHDPAREDAIGDYVEVDDASGINVGDFVLFERLLVDRDDDRLTARAGGSFDVRFRSSFFDDFLPDEQEDWATYKAWGGAKPDASLGNYYLEIVVPDGETLNLGKFWASNVSQDFYVRPGTDTFVCDFWAEADASLTLTCTTGETGESTQNVSVSATGGWKSWEHTWSGTPAENQKGVKRWSMQWTNSTGSAVTIKFCSLNFYKDGDPYGYQYYEDVLLKDGVPVASYLRNHTTSKPGLVHWREEALFDADGSGDQQWFWGLCEAVGIDPWDQTTFTAGSSFWERIAEEMVARPFTSWKLETGNEKWQSGSVYGFVRTESLTDSVTAQVYTVGEVAGLIDVAIYGWMGNVSGFSGIEGDITKHFGGWRGSQAWNTGASYAGDDIDEISLAAYTGGWDVGETGAADETISSFQRMAGIAGVLYDPSGAAGFDLVDYASDLSTTLGRTITPTMYEFGPGYQISGNTQEEIVAQECIGKSRGSAVATLDLACRASENGGYPAWFLLHTNGDTFSSHNKDVTAFMPWEILRELYGKVGRDPIVHPFLKAKGSDLPFDVSESETYDLDRIGVTAFQSTETAGRWVLVVRNLFIDESVFSASDPDYTDGSTNATDVLIRSLFTSATSCTYLSAAMGNPRHHNRYIEGYRRDPNVGTSAGSYEYTVADPLAVTFDYTWSAGTLPSDGKDFLLSDVIGGNLSGLNAVVICFEGVTA